MPSRLQMHVPLEPVPSKANLRLLSKKRAPSFEWQPSPRDASPRNNLEAVATTTDVYRHLQNMSTLLKDMPPLVSPATMQEQLEFHIGSLEEMRANITVLVSSFMGNAEVIQRLLEMHDRLDQCISLHRSAQADSLPMVDSATVLNSVLSSSGKNSGRRTDDGQSLSQIRKRKLRAREMLSRTSSSPSRLTPPRPEKPLLADENVPKAFEDSPKRTSPRGRSSRSLHSRSKSKRRVKKETEPSRAVNSFSAPAPSSRLLSGGRSLTESSLSPTSSSPGPARLGDNRQLERKSVSSNESDSIILMQANTAITTCCSPPPPPPTPASGLVNPEIGGAVVRRLASPIHDHSRILAEVSRRLSSGTESTEDELESDEDKAMLERIRARLLEVSAASSRSTDRSFMPPRSAPRKNNPSPLSPSKTVRTKSDSAFICNVEVRARLEVLIESLKSPSDSPSARSRESRELMQSSPTPVVRVRRHRRKRRKEKSGLEVNCPICWEGNPLEACVRLAACGHLYCSSCVSTYCTTKINEGQVLAFTCPDPKCLREITPNELVNLVDESTFRRYQQFHMLATLNINPNCRWCPRPGCNTSIIADPSQPMVVCQTCQMEFCFQCKEPWHGDLPCGSKTSERDESLSAYMAASDAKKCPNCDNLIERNKGCNMMKCCVCAHQFCWLCLEPYTLDHYDDGPCKGKWGVSKTEMALVYTLAGGMIVASAAVAIPTVVIGAPIYGSYRIGKWVKKGRKKSKRKF